MKKTKEPNIQPKIQPNYLEVLIFGSKITIYSHGGDSDLADLVKLLAALGLCLSKESESLCG